MSTSIQQPGPTRSGLRRLRLVLMCFSVGANAICAGGVFCFPIIAPALVTHLKLTQPQLTTIALAGMMGQYPFAALVGKILDYYGAWACSLISACLFSAGYGLFANEISKSSDAISQPSDAMFHHLVILFFMCGLGTVFSYFSSIFAASKNFPNYLGVATGTSTALFGLSPTFLSLLASRYFSSPDGEINITYFLRFMAILCGCVHLVGGLTMHVIPSLPEEESKSAVTESDPEVPNERTALLPNKPNMNDEGAQVQADITSVSDDSPEHKDGALDLLSNRSFWALLYIVFVVMGSCEMIISNIGTIVLSLPDQTSVNTLTFAGGSSAVLMTATQVRILSVANTLSRLLVGPLADVISPTPSRTVDGQRGFLKKHRISRIAFLTFSTGTLICTYAWMVVGVREQVDIWALSIGAGLAYGCAFTILPSLVSSIWGLPNLGRNYGIITYAPFLGTPAFSYLYAFIAAAHAPDANFEPGPDQEGACHGPACWRLTFEVSTLSAALAFGASIYLWRAWKGRV